MSIRGYTCEQKPYGATIKDKNEIAWKQCALFTNFMNVPKRLLLQR